MIELEKYYNKKDWDNLVDLCRGNWTNSSLQVELLKTLNGMLDIAIVLWMTHKSASSNWIKSGIPALDNLRPIDCLKNEKLIKRLKVCLLRIP